MDQKETNQREDKDLDPILELGSDVSRSRKGNIYTLTIIGQVEGHQVLLRRLRY